MSLLGGALGRLRALPPRPKLTVLVILEQFRPDYLDAGRPRFPAGGFKRLLEKGAFFPDCRHLASTFPASSVATLATGAWPAQHGIVADNWYDGSFRQSVSASDEDLLATTLAAQIAAEPRTRVSVIAMNLSQATLFAGRAAARLFWMDERGQFATTGEPPDWLTALNGQKTAEGVRNRNGWRSGPRRKARRCGRSPTTPSIRKSSSRYIVRRRSARPRSSTSERTDRPGTARAAEHVLFRLPDAAIHVAARIRDSAAGRR